MPLSEGLVEFLGVGPIGRVPIECVPEDQRRQYRFWRATSLAKLALVFETGATSINLDTNPTIHFFDNNDSNRAYEDALLWADTVVHAQLKPRDMRELTRLTGQELVREHLPRIVFALDTPFNDLRNSIGVDLARPGVDLHRSFDLADIDPYSRDFIETLLA